MSVGSLVTLSAPALDRRTWANAHIQHTVFRPAKDIKVHAFATSTQYLDSFNSLASVTLDPGPVELRAFGGVRNFLGATVDGRAEQVALDKERLFYGFELGRSYYHKETGAIRLGWLQFPETQLGFVTIGIETSRRLNFNSPWFYRMLFSYWVNILGKTTGAGGDCLNLNLEITKNAESHFLGISEWGAFLSMSLRNPDVGKMPDGRYDVVAFGLSPTAKWQSSSGNWEASLDLRFFLDAEKRAGQSTTNPSALAVPGVSVRWGQPQ